ncbi:MAG: helix-turn-helix domain-containing protein [Ruminococcus sp.]|nr:helix-turn-helix domain-containing protein [Ruminococcus sp.]
MNPEKIGRFIKELREEKGLTQEGLGELIPIGREAISKWERGKTYPDYQTLLRLSEIFNVTTNELLYGEKENKENKSKVVNINGVIYQERNKIKKTIFKLIVLLIIMCTLFFGYYFYYNYNSIKAYDVKYYSDNINLQDGLLIITREKIYFTTNEIKTNEEIKNLRLYYKERDNKERLIMETDSDKITLINFVGTDEYFNYDNIKYIIKNLYLEITFKETIENIKLEVNESFANDYIIPEKLKVNYPNPIHNEYPTILEIKLKEKLTLDKGGIYFYRNKNEEIFYIDEAKLIIYCLKDHDITKEWQYREKNNYLLYREYNGTELLRQYECQDITKDDDNEIIKALQTKLQEFLN